MRMVGKTGFELWARSQKLSLAHRPDAPYYASRETRIAYFQYEESGRKYFAEKCKAWQDSKFLTLLKPYAKSLGLVK